MTSTKLDRAIFALRRRHTGCSHEAARTEKSILDALEKRRPFWVRRRWGLPLAVAFAGSTAWAATHPEVASIVKSWLASMDGTGAHNRAKPSAVARSRQTIAAVASHAATADASYSEPPVLAHSPSCAADADTPPSHADESRMHGEQLAIEEHESTKANRRKPRGHSGVSEVSKADLGASAPAPSTLSLELFRSANWLQFHQHDAAGALLAWERYIAVDPHGPLVLEARYHRATCLLELGRKSEAKAALCPFALGQYGSYRQTEAQVLLDRLDGVVHSEPSGTRGR